MHSDSPAMHTRCLLVLTAVVVYHGSAKTTCCFGKWGDASQCGSYPTGSGGKCNNAWTKVCNGNNDCPATPAPAPPAPAPPAPAPPSPPTPPGPPTPSPTPPSPSGDVKGFWFHYWGGGSPNPAPSNGWFFSFPGLVVNPPFKSNPYGPIMSPPAWGKYEKKILTQGGGDTSWGNSMYKKLEGMLPSYKPAGWDGVCWDWEKAAADHTTDGFNSLMKSTKAAGLINIVTSTAEGPYIWSASDNDATKIDWSLVDYFVPQLYGAAGTLPSGWEEYARYWTEGAGKPNVHNVTFAKIPMDKILWGMPAGSCNQGKQFGGAGCVEWAYASGVHPPPSPAIYV